MSEYTDEELAELERIRSTAKKNFDPRERLRNRGLRRDTITVYLDEVTGEKLGRNYPQYDQFNNVMSYERTGVIGKIADLEDKIESDAAEYQKSLLLAEDTADEASTVKALAKAHKAQLKIDEAKLADLYTEREELKAELHRTGLTFKLRAVPPVIDKDCHRLAKQSLGIEGKGVPEDRKDEVSESRVAHLLVKMTEELIDNETGASNSGITYEEAMDMPAQLPPGQWSRLDLKMGELQYTDGISRTIEMQEDFS